MHGWIRLMCWMVNEVNKLNLVRASTRLRFANLLRNDFELSCVNLAHVAALKIDDVDEGKERKPMCCTRGECHQAFS